MYVKLHQDYRDTPEGQSAAQYLSACVHCGFCLATCPTYLDSQDERDSPRGRIYLIKELLESGTASNTTQNHLDRCLSCRSCETTCPSGVQYGALADIGRVLLEQKVKRPLPVRTLRWLLRKTIPRPALFGSLLKIGQFFRPLLPARLKNKIPEKQKTFRYRTPPSTTTRTMLVLAGCVQSTATPNTNAATTRVLARLGIELISVKEAGCCGAVNYHMAAVNDGLNDMRRNIDTWWPLISGAEPEAIVSTATGCGAVLADYGNLLAHDPAYASKAARVSELYKDISEILLAEDLPKLTPARSLGKIAVHTPCSMSHALKLPDNISAILQQAGFDLAETTDKHLCCGSAGTYSILQPDVSQRLLNSKIQALNIDQPTVIATANVGCQLHLASESQIPVRHWIELLDESSA